jgi:hypothetical protein
MSVKIDFFNNFISLFYLALFFVSGNKIILTYLLFQMTIFLLVIEFSVKSHLPNFVQMSGRTFVAI